MKDPQKRPMRMKRDLCVCVHMCVCVLDIFMQRVAVCCSMLQYVAVCCSVTGGLVRPPLKLQCVAVCCSMLQYVAVCCSMLQYVAV